MITPPQLRHITRDSGELGEVEQADRRDKGNEREEENKTELNQEWIHKTSVCLCRRMGKTLKDVAI